MRKINDRRPPRNGAIFEIRVNQNRANSGKLQLQTFTRCKLFKSTLVLKYFDEQKRFESRKNAKVCKRVHYDDDDADANEATAALTRTRVAIAASVRRRRRRRVKDDEPLASTKRRFQAARCR